MGDLILLFLLFAVGVVACIGFGKLLIWLTSR